MISGRENLCDMTQWNRSYHWKAILNPSQQQVKACGWNHEQTLLGYQLGNGHAVTSLNSGVMEMPIMMDSEYRVDHDLDGDVPMKNCYHDECIGNDKYGKACIFNAKSKNVSYLEMSRVKLIAGYLGYCFIVNEAGQVYARRPEKCSPVTFREYDSEEDEFIEVDPNISRIECGPFQALFLDSSSGRVFKLKDDCGDCFSCEMIHYFVDRNEKVLQIACSEHGCWFVTLDQNGTQNFYTYGDTITTFGMEIGTRAQFTIYENEFLKSSTIVQIQRRYGIGIILLQDGRLFGVSSQRRKFTEMNRSKIDDTNEIIQKVMIGSNFIIALISRRVCNESRVLLWGDLGHSKWSFSSTIIPLQAIPTELPFQPQHTNEYITDISCGLRHLMLTSSHGSLYSMGTNTQGQLGNGTPFDSFLQPTCTDLSLQENEFISNIYCYHFHSCVVIEKVNSRLIGFFRNVQNSVRMRAFSDCCILLSSH
ncbi:hypothetical protein C9374_000603 [Naegleria lovaniensis]|uniref:Uncharacterized protein n=1 Tax=Naegleria lovaniensis TaxID=51637 RepID=A0AA88GYP4_NAELO|nr:uncharacterized protein C9374_000603 [Naegleria lovaniensis]KAG2388439.1 hypothetical protein C9374_000603 [Naegleria lovaniensis]